MYGCADLSGELPGFLRCGLAYELMQGQGCNVGEMGSKVNEKVREKSSRGQRCRTQAW